MEKLSIILLIILLWACGSSIDSIPFGNHKYKQLQLFKSNDGVYFEEDIGNHKVPFMEDNFTYLSCQGLLYELAVIKNKREYFINKFTDEIDEWSLDTFASDRSIQYLSMIVSDTISENRNLAYNQTFVTYDYLSGLNESLLTETTGVVENYLNIWLHNPRSTIFKAIFISPWPYLKFPLIDGKTYDYSFAYSNDYMGDSRLINWDGIVKFDYEYTIIGKEWLDLQIGRVEAYHIRAKGISSIGVNYADFYFNSKLGFVVYEFNTISGFKITLTPVIRISDCNNRDLGLTADKLYLNNNCKESGNNSKLLVKASY